MNRNIEQLCITIWYAECIDILERLWIYFWHKKSKYLKIKNFLIYECTLQSFMNKNWDLKLCQHPVMRREVRSKNEQAIQTPYIRCSESCNQSFNFSNYSQNISPKTQFINFLESSNKKNKNGTSIICNSWSSSELTFEAISAKNVS